MLINGITRIRTRFALDHFDFISLQQARTALFSYFFARHYGGTWILRIDDSKKAKTPKEIERLTDTLIWLGLDCDDGPFFQSHRRVRYDDAAIALIKSGDAYPEPTRYEDSSIYRGINRNVSCDIAYSLWDDTGWPVRLRIDDGERIILDDIVQGKVLWLGQQISDPILLNGNGTASAAFASVLDDLDMQVTHVIRDKSYLSQTAVELLIYKALERTPPFYAHLEPVSDGTKETLTQTGGLKLLTPEYREHLAAMGYQPVEMGTSWDCNPISLGHYQAMGYKPRALVNYLSTLGWNHHDTDMTTSELYHRFSLNKAKEKANLDVRALADVNYRHLRQDGPDAKAVGCIAFLSKAKLINKMPSSSCYEYVRNVVRLCDDRLHSYSDIVRHGGFFFTKPTYNAYDVNKYLTDEAVTWLENLIVPLESIRVWTADNIDKAVHNFIHTTQARAVSVFFALRVAISGHNLGPALANSMEILGKDECLERLSLVVTKFTGNK